MRSSRSFSLGLGAALLASLVAQVGCAGLAYTGRGVAMGAIYADSSANEQLAAHKQGTKQGRACSSSVLGLVTTGDASASRAAQAAGIEEIATVDNTFTNVLGIWARYCTVVSGS